MATFTFKRGLIRGPETWTVDGSCISNDEKDTKVSWDELDEVRFSDVPAGKVNVAELVFFSETGKVQLQCNDKRGSENRRSFLMLCREVTNQLDKSNPQIRFLPTTGTQVAGWSFALMGLAAFIFGLYYIGVGLMTRGEAGSGFAMGMGGFAALFGCFLAWCGAPWQKPQPKSPSETREWIDRILTMG